MTVELQNSSPSKARLYTGMVFTVLVILFMTMDGVVKLTHAAAVLDANRQLEIPPTLTPVLGVIALICTAVYAIPATTVLGAILLTGYLGGAIAIQARIGSPFFSHTLFPIYIALFLWGGLWLRDQMLRDQFPVVKRPVNSAKSKAALYAGYAIGTLAAVLVLLSAVMKFIYKPGPTDPPPGFPLEHIHTLAYIEITLVVLYFLPRMTFFGAAFLTGYLGGATAVDLRAGEGAAGAHGSVGSCGGRHRRRPYLGFGGFPQCHHLRHGRDELRRLADRRGRDGAGAADQHRFRHGRPDADDRDFDHRRGRRLHRLGRCRRLPPDRARKRGLDPRPRLLRPGQ